ncbi:hypothetical protein [Streptomyces bluensis]|uniref:hypothetical protein n=1 Tax=Streptomyces bluensis TaxID=33897 RepID=UPI0010631079|nr:hypothetical protein [Streptomyces bluensis]
MTDFIGRVIAWVSILLTGRDPHAKPPSRPTRTAPASTCATPLPAHRSPYGLDDSDPLDGAATRAVRPYVIALDMHGLEVA